MNREAHNALYESGTMRNEKGEQSESFFHPVKVQPNTHFVHFITLEAGTKEMLLYVVHNILNTGRYGARETRTGRNMKNEIVGAITSSGDSGLSCGEMINDHISGGKTELSREDIIKAISEYINTHKRADWKIYYAEEFKLDGGIEFPEWMKNLISIASRQKKEDLDILRSALETIRNEGLDAVEKKGKPDTTVNDAAQSKLDVVDEEKTA
jgi:CRISPR-associated protein Csc2